MMKRILFAVLAALLLFSLAACRKEGEENQVTSDPGENSMIESTSETEASSPDYDENGNLILFSTQERPVIKSSFGYYIFRFDENQLSSLMVVYDEQTAEAAQELYDTMTAPGYNQTDFVSIVCSGQYVVCTASTSSTRYGYLFKMQRLDILGYFYNGRQNATSE